MLELFYKEEILPEISNGLHSMKGTCLYYMKEKNKHDNNAEEKEKELYPTLSITGLFGANKTLLYCSCKEFKQNKNCLHINHIRKKEYEFNSASMKFARCIPQIKQNITTCEDCLYTTSNFCINCKDIEKKN